MFCSKNYTEFVLFSDIHDDNKTRLNEGNYFPKPTFKCVRPFLCDIHEYKKIQQSINIGQQTLSHFLCLCTIISHFPFLNGFLKSYS